MRKGKKYEMRPKTKEYQLSGRKGVHCSVNGTGTPISE